MPLTNVTILLPCFNEEQALPTVIRDIREAMRQVRAELHHERAVQRTENPDVNQDRSNMCSFSFDSGATKSFSSEMTAPRTAIDRRARTSVQQSGSAALTHPRAIGMPGR